MVDLRLAALVILLSILAALSLFLGKRAPTNDRLVPVTFQLTWFPQAEFAGFWAAGGHPPGGTPSRNVPVDGAGLNFYAQEGLEVTLLSGGNVNPTVNVTQGLADFGTDWIANVLVQVEAGLDLVHIAQLFQLPGYLFVASRSSGVARIEDFVGRNVGVWDFGNEFVAEACFAVHGLTSDLDPAAAAPDITTTVYAFDPALVFPDRVDVASAMVYNELNQIVGLGFSLDELNVISAHANGCGLLENLIFTTRALLASDNWRGTGVSGQELAQRFVRATLKGWQWALDHQDDAVEIVLEFCQATCTGSGPTQPARVHQTWQMSRVAEMVQPALLTDPAMLALYGLTATPHEATLGCLDLDDYAHTLALLEQVGLIQPGTGDPDVVVHPEILEGAGVDCD